MIKFEPLNKKSGFGAEEVSYETASKVLAASEALAISDEKVAVWSSKEGEINMGFLRLLAIEKAK